MTLSKYILIFFICLLLSAATLAQCPGTIWSNNVTLKCVTNFGREGAADVWGWEDTQSGIPYALVMLDGGLSIVNTQNPSSPTEKVHINHIGYHNQTKQTLEVVDVETFDSGGNTYAYLSVHRNDSTYFVLIINLNQAIANSGEYLIEPVNANTNPNSVFAGRIQNPQFEVWQAHTLTITDGYLYVATLKDKIPVWNLNSSATSPTYKGAITVTPSNSEVHEMYVKSTGSTTSRIYAACSRGGLQVIDLNLQNMSFTKTSQTYDSDKSSPNLVNSADSYFEYRQTHSAWPTDNGQYIFTTDELSLWPPNDHLINMPDDPNLYIDTNVLRSVHRQGNFLRTWKTSKLGSLNSLKSGFYVAENQQAGFVNLNDINSSFVPNSIHQMYGKGKVLYVSHYTQGLRVLDISNPENLVEVGYYDDYPSINDTPYDTLFFRNNKWYQGIYGVYPDPNRPGIVYASSLNNGFYIFDVLAIASPTGFTLSGPVGGNPTLTWNASSAPGLEGYKIYQEIDNSNYSLLVTLDKNLHHLLIAE
ncbi:MAG: hypothetical protein KKD86_06145 [Bacteroidetes bacterium]|nr:hypothetical protein [Bacteroidota bacterium]